MAIDFNKPADASARTGFMQEIRDNIIELAKFLGGSTISNPPDGIIRYNPTDKKFEKYASATQTWSALDLTGVLVTNATNSTNSTNATNATNADTVDNIHASATPTANKLLALDANAKLPSSITGDADTVDTKHASDLLARANHTGTQSVSTLSDHNKTNHDSLSINSDTVDGYHASSFSIVGHSHMAVLMSRANNTVYQAATDGVVYGYGTVSSYASITGLVGGGNPPNITVQTQSGVTVNGCPAAICFPVKKYDYWKVTGCSAVYWTPLA